MSFTDYHGALAYALGRAATLVLAAFLTPARWWRRPTARGLAILGGGTWACGILLLHAFGTAAPAGASAGSGGSTEGGQVDAFMQHPPARPMANAAADLPVRGERYRVHRDLNVRDAAGVGAARLAVVPAGSFVTPTGTHDGDWWQVRYEDGSQGTSRTRTGWTSSLWLRSAAEH
jgi:hypothetical protein